MKALVMIFSSIISIVSVAGALVTSALAVPSQTIPVPASATATRVAIDSIQDAPVGQEVEVVGYFSHKSDEIDGDLQVWLIDHRGNFVVVEAPKRFRDMKYFIRGMRLHRGELVIARGVMTRQHDKPTTEYRNGWMEIQPVDYIARYEGPKPSDLHYVRVAHHLFGRVTTTQE
ncbi:MAG TPA: hypothetical protein VFO25_09980 [Candidatus Eremiobacteraceae bacterium]|nr:hypothetical protein [Candidatus Eremiobacteraceae bacterium]